MEKLFEASKRYMLVLNFLRKCQKYCVNLSRSAHGVQAPLMVLLPGLPSEKRKCIDLKHKHTSHVHLRVGLHGLRVRLTGLLQ